MLSLLAAPFVACMVLAGIHGYLGIHVLMRRVLFVDLALAQMAAMGAAVGTLVDVPLGTGGAFAMSLAFTLVGAAIFALVRPRRDDVPHEATIGIVYAVAWAVTILVASRTAVGTEEIRALLEGRLLFVGWSEIGRMAALYGCVGAVHYLARRPLLAASRGGGGTKAWDFLFYATFGVVVTSSVEAAGVLLVFSFLIAPATCAMILWRSLGGRILGAWTFGFAGSVGGLAASAVWDLPTAASVIVVFGVLFAVVLMATGLRTPRIRSVGDAAARPPPG